MCAACTEKPCSDHSSLTTEVPSVPPPPAAEAELLSPAVLTTVSPFSAIWESFPFITVRSPTVLHGVLPLSLDDSTLFLTSTPCDAALFGDNELDISSEASPARWSSLAHACLRDGLMTLRRALLARLRSPGPSACSCDCPYDRLPQLLLLLLVQLRHREPLDAALAPSRRLLALLPPRSPRG